MSGDKTVRVSLAPTPGYCFKSTALSSVLCRLAAQPPPAPSQDSLAPALPGTLFIPNGVKVFVNIAWDQNVPPPPEASEETIKRAMRGPDDVQDQASIDVSFKDVLKEDLIAESEWTVPVVVSEPRQVIDKAGNPSIVFDCVYNPSIKSRALQDFDFRAFINELSIQRIEAQCNAVSAPSANSPNGLLLSRDLKVPNIASKGKLAKRTVLVPRHLYSQGGTEPTQDIIKLVEEVKPTPSTNKKEEGKPKKGILKNVAQSSPTLVAEISTPPKKVEEVKTTPSSLPPKSSSLKQPSHKWAKEPNGRCLILDVPDLTRITHASSTLDVEPRRIIFAAPPLYSLDIDVSQANSSNETEKEFDVKGARAEWRVKEGKLLVYV